MEKTITNKIIRHINKAYPNTEVTKRLSTGASNNTGYPDIHGSICGIRVEIEVKQPGKKPTKLQLSRLRKLKRLNAIAFWTDSLEDCIAKLEKGLASWRPRGLKSLSERRYEAFINGELDVWQSDDLAA